MNDQSTIIDEVANHLERYEILARVAREDANADDLLVMLTDLNAAFRSTLDRLAS